jgi:hypothetical protein
MSLTIAQSSRSAALLASNSSSYQSFHIARRPFSCSLHSDNNGLRFFSSLARCKGSQGSVLRHCFMPSLESSPGVSPGCVQSCAPRVPQRTGPRGRESWREVDCSVSVSESNSQLDFPLTFCPMIHGILRVAVLPDRCPSSFFNHSRARDDFPAVLRRVMSWLPIRKCWHLRGVRYVSTGIVDYDDPPVRLSIEGLSREADAVELVPRLSSGRSQEQRLRSETSASGF